MTPQIAIDFDELEARARRLLASVESLGTPIDLAAVTGIDTGAFGVTCSALGLAVEEVSHRATSMLRAASHAEERIATQVGAMRSDFLRIEEAAVVAFDQLDANRPHISVPPAVTPDASPPASHIRGGLVADPRDVSTVFSGTGLLDDLDQIDAARAAKDGKAELIATIASDVDTVAAIVDPIGSLVGAGLGWALEHFEPVAGAVDDLTGDPARVRGWAETWHRIASLLAADIDDVRAGDRRLADMTGTAVASYRGLQQQLLDHLGSAVTWSENFATTLDVAAECVQVAHDGVRDLFAGVVGSLVTWAGEELFSLGIATPAVIAQVVSRAAALVTKAGTIVARLVEVVGRIVAPLTRMADRFGSLTSVLKRVARHDVKDATELVAAGAVEPGARLTSAEPGSGTGGHFADEDYLHGHYEDHGSDFGATSQEEYARQADDFLTSPLDDDATTMELTRTNEDRVRFNPITDEFGIITKDGVIRTYYKPTLAQHPQAATNIEYFRQEGNK